MFSNNDFHASPALVRAAETLVAAQSRLAAVAPIVDAYQREILERHQWRVAREWVDSGDEDGVVLDPEQSYLLEDSDSAVYFSECSMAAAAARLGTELPEGCPKLEARDAVRMAENALLDEMSSIPGLGSLKTDGYLPLELRAKAIDATLNLLAPYLRNAQPILNEFKDRTPKLPKMG